MCHETNLASSLGRKRDDLFVANVDGYMWARETIITTKNTLFFRIELATELQHIWAPKQLF